MRRLIRSTSCLTLVALAAALTLSAATAQAIVVQTQDGPISYLPPRTAAPTADSPATRAAHGGPLVYHGGSVMHSSATYAIFWAPSGYSFPAGYTAAVNTFLDHVAADSGQPSNVYSVGTQYTDTSGARAAYSVTHPASFTDTTAYPLLPGCSPYSVGGVSYSKCLTDTQISNEVNSFVNAHGLPRGLGTQYLVLTPPGVGSCFDVTGTQCYDRDYCAYHSYNNSGGTTLYSNLGFNPGDPQGCGTGEYPNGGGAGGADDVLSVLSHEANETITDPRLDAWYDADGEENADKCRLTSDDYGPSLGGAAGSLYNQLIDAGHYYLQMEWSNSAGGCRQRAVVPSAAFTAAVAVAGSPTAFNGTASSDADGAIRSYAWSFGDGGAGSGAAPSHTFAAPGSYDVTLTVTDDGGYTDAATKTVVVAAAGSSPPADPSPPAEPSSQPASPAAATTAAPKRKPLRHKKRRHRKRHKPIRTAKTSRPS
jgi:PKD repeat protein